MFKQGVDYTGVPKIQYFLQDLNPPALVELFLIDFNTAIGFNLLPDESNLREILYLTNEKQSFSYENRIWRHSSIEFEPVAVSVTSPILQPTLKISNLDSDFVYAINNYPILTGASLVRMRTMPIFFDSIRTNYGLGTGVNDYNSDTEVFSEFWYFEDVISKSDTEILIRLNSTLGLNDKAAMRTITGVVYNGNR